MMSRALATALGACLLLCVRHYFELQEAAVLLFLQEFAAFFHVDVVPRQYFGHGPGALRIPGGVNVQIAERAPPEVGLEALAPAIHAGAAAPGLFENHRNAPIAARQHAFEQAAIDVVLLHFHRTVTAVVA